MGAGHLPVFIWVYRVMELEEVVEKAVEFLERRAGYFFHKLLKAELARDGRWYIEFDVGVASPTIIRIVVDNETGRIVEYKLVEGGPG